MRHGADHPNRRVRHAGLLFAGAALMLLASLVWMVRAERNRPWKLIQREFGTLTAGLARLDQLSTGTATSEASGLQSARVQQVTVPQVYREVAGVAVPTVDRCVTCHVAIDRAELSRPRLAQRLERAVEAINARLNERGQPLLRPPLVEERLDLDVGQVAAAWDTLTVPQQETFLDAAAGVANQHETREGRHAFRVEQPWFAHPRLDLYVAADSPHPWTTMGCSVCHGGNGHATDFDAAGHGATMFPAQEVEAGCAACHTRIADATHYHDKPAATRLHEGALLFMGLGCAQCHPAEGFNAARFGPDLTRVGMKRSTSFLQQWIDSPQRVRPAALMPRYPQMTAGQAAAITAYLCAGSDVTECPPPTTARWTTELADERSPAVKAARQRGRRLFGALGCPACHTSLSYQPDAGTGRADVSVGSQWITRDLETRFTELARAVWLDQARVLKRKLDGSGVSLSDLNDLSDQLLRELCAGRSRDQLLDTLQAAVDAGGMSADYDPRRAHESAAAVLFKSRPETLRDVVLTDAERAKSALPASFAAAAARYAERTCGQMTTEARLQYALAAFPDATSLMAGAAGPGPVFSRWAPELSGLRDEFESYVQAVSWLYAWLSNPHQGWSETRMPRFRLGPYSPGPGQDSADEALDLAVYLSSFTDGGVLATTPAATLTDRDLPDELRERLSALPETLAASLTDRLAGSRSREAVRAWLAALEPARLRELTLGGALVEQYGCHGCHRMTGYETARPSTLAIAEVVTRPASVRHRHGETDSNLPCFSLNPRQSAVMRTFLRSRGGPLVRPPLRVEDVPGTRADVLATGRTLTRTWNCVGCHRIEGNETVLSRFVGRVQAGRWVPDEHQLPPDLGGKGATARSAQWIRDYLRDVPRIRPELTVRMPSFPLTEAQRTALAEYLDLLGRP